MRGAPRFFATKQDYLNGIETFPEETKAALRALIAERYQFVRTGELATGEEGVTDADHTVFASFEVDEKTGEKVEKHYQLERQEDSNARLFRIGFTVDEAEKLVS